MDEPLFYHAIATVAHGEYHAINKYRGGHETWEAAYYALKEKMNMLPRPREVYERMEEMGLCLVLSTEKEYPDRLRYISHPPFGIYVRGDLKAYDLSISIVGTRNATEEGKITARQFARELTSVGFTIVSGLAFGIDAAAHQGCLDANGITVAVLAGGLDSVYPHTHQKLAQKIIEAGGALISEYPPGEPPVAYRFIERNRIISGMSRGVLIVEAPESSGALATARYAVEHNRDVFVTPGNLAATNFKGSHALIRQGAEFVSSPQDIIEAYGVTPKQKHLIIEGSVTGEQILILKALESSLIPLDVDKIIQMTKLEPRIINQALTSLIIRGAIKESDVGYTI